MALAALALGSATVCAQPARLLLELRLDGQPGGPVVPLLVRDGMAWATAAEWSALGLASGDATPSATGDGLLPATALAHDGLSLDLSAGTLTVHRPHGARPAVALAAAGAGADAAPWALTPSEPALVLNYDYVGQQSGQGLHHGLLLNARWVAQDVVLEHSQLLSGAGRLHTRPLLSTLTWSDPERLRKLRLGDVVAGGLPWSRAVRLRGVQFGTDFGMRPDLLTAPTLAVAGSAAVPSTVDVFVNGVRQFSQAVEPGPFAMRQAPVVTGAGELQVVTRDALGRETVQVLPYYYSNRLLRPGLASYSFELGRLDQRAGGSARAREWPAAVLTHRLGLTDHLTLEAHAVGAPSLALATAGVQARLWDLGVAAAGLGMSRHRARTAPLLMLSLERHGPVLGLSATLQRNGAGAADLAALQAGLVQRHSLRVMGSLSLGRLGSLGAGWVDMRNESLAGQPPAPRSRVFSLSGVTTLGPRVQALVTLHREMQARGGAGVTLSLSMPLDDRVMATASAYRQGGVAGLSLQAGAPAELGGNPGWQVLAEQGLQAQAPQRQLAHAQWATRLASWSADAERYDHRHSTRAGVRGALLVVDGRFHAAATVDDGVALVEVPGAANVGISLENRPVGRTDEQGQLMVTGLQSFQTNRLSVEPLDLPLSQSPLATQQSVRPGERAVVKVRFALQTWIAPLVRVLDAQGRPLPPGALLLSPGNERAVPVGHDGLAALQDPLHADGLQARWAQGQGCTLRPAGPAQPPPVLPATAVLQCE